ncbi:MAG: recombinase family protein [Candidatus Methanomethylophilaceae archaeon]|nr:recombinase family protein [Thermoplasmata archaeon]MBQ3685011.1 recombinase family protein [Candidatus Methanomethylophilaceae archaeon]
MLLRRLEREGKAFVSVSGPEDHLEDTESRRAAVYIRVSTEEQAMEGYSLGAQEALLREFCVSQGWAVHQVYIDDGYSGRNDNRPSYRRMMEEIGDWDVLLVMKMDRIHRNFRNFMTMMETLERNGKKFASVNENLDTSNAVGRFATDIIMRIAQLESEQTGERTYMGMREKAETLEKADSGKRTMGFTPPFGYALEGGKLVAVPEELSVVSRIFSMYLGGTTMEMICYELNSSGELTRKGNPWNKFNLRNVLHNPVYAGYMRWEDVLIHHDAGNAVSPEDYNAVQELMASRVRDPSKRTVFLVPVLRLRTIVY